MRLFSRKVPLAPWADVLTWPAGRASLAGGGAARRNVGAAGVVIGLEGGNEAVMLPSVAPLIRL